MCVGGSSSGSSSSIVVVVVVVIVAFSVNGVLIEVTQYSNQIRPDLIFQTQLANILTSLPLNSTPQQNDTPLLLFRQSYYSGWKIEAGIRMLNRTETIS